MLFAADHDELHRVLRKFIAAKFIAAEINLSARIEGRLRLANPGTRGSVNSPPSTRLARGGEGLGVGGGASSSRSRAGTESAETPPTPDPSPPLRGGRGAETYIGLAILAGRRREEIAIG